MQEKKFMKVFRAAKIIQLCLLLLLEVIFFLVLIFNPYMSKHIYDNSTLFTLCAITWGLMLFNLLCLLYDFWQLRSFTAESHALNRAAYLDNLTGIPNRHGLDIVFQTYDTPESMARVGCFMGTIENLKAINEVLGHSTGDLMIQHFCSIFEEVGDTFGVVGRNGGNEYVMVINNCTHDIMKKFIHALNEQIKEYNSEHTKAPISIRYTYILNEEEHAEAFTQLLTSTYNKLHSMI